MGGLISKPKAPKLPPPPEPAPEPPTDEQLSVAGSEAERRKKKLRRGLQSTILTGSSGSDTTNILGG